MKRPASRDHLRPDQVEECVCLPCPEITKCFIITGPYCRRTFESIGINWRNLAETYVRLRYIKDYKKFPITLLRQPTLNH